VEAIQSQIDLSLSLAFDLVASWSTPKDGDASKSRPGTLSSIPDVDDLKQWLHRPPRLGVGAPNPAATDSSNHSVKEINMLKRRLLPGLKKKTKDNTTLRYHSKKVDDDDDDSRTASFSVSKKRTRPFDAFEPKDKRSKQQSDNARFAHHPSPPSFVSTTWTETTNSPSTLSTDSPSVAENRQESSSTLTSSLSMASSESPHSSTITDNAPGTCTLSSSTPTIDPSRSPKLVESVQSSLMDSSQSVPKRDAPHSAEPVTTNQGQKTSGSKRRRQRKKENRLKGVGGTFVQHTT